MIATVEEIRREYALAYSASLPSDESAKLKDSDSIDEYVSWWCREYGRDMVKIARIAQEALTDLANGASTEAVRAVSHINVLHGSSEVVRVLLDNIEPLRSVLLFDPVDGDTFKRTMELIVDAFSQPTS